MSFTGFSEEDLQRIKSGETRPNNVFTEPTLFLDHQNIIKPAKFGNVKTRQFNLKNIVGKKVFDDSFDEMQFEKCRLSIKSPSTAVNIGNNNNETLNHEPQNNSITVIETNDEDGGLESDNSERKEVEDVYSNNLMRKDSSDVTPDIVSTRQTEEEVVKLEKIKKELQVLDGQFSQDINVLRKKIDQACLTYSEAEKQYLRVEKEFLQAKIQLQKEKEKKELLTEHLCALITHNETRKAQKLETLMLELASSKKLDISEVNAAVTPPLDDDKDEKPIVVDGVDERTGKMVEMNTES